MPQSGSARKRIRQDKGRRVRARAIKSALHTEIRKLEEAIAEGDADAAQSRLLSSTRTLDRAATKGVIPKNRASRRKSRLSRAVSRIAAAE